jgi:sugar phosphate isomerase/epimerase
MERRDCLKIAGLTAGAALANRMVFATGRPPPNQRQFGLQLFTVRENLKAAPVQTLEAVADMGFKEAELFGFGGNIFVDDPLYGLTPREFRRVLDDCDLTVATTTVSGDPDIPAVAEIAHPLGIRYLTIGMAPEFISVTETGAVVSGVTGVEQMKTIAERLNRQGLECKNHGLGLAYHNHHMEFERLEELEGMPAFDYLMQQTDPALVKIEFDVGWMAGAGVDPAQYLRRYGDRVIATHLKDFNPALPVGRDLERFPIPIMSQLVELGTGVVDFARVLAVMDEIGVAHGFVEVDITDTPMETARRSLEHLRSITGRAITK